MLQIIHMMANSLIWKGADLENESDCMNILVASHFDIHAIGKYVQRAMRIARNMEKE